MKRQRTTFSPIEVWELERAYRQQPYLLSQDEEDLVQRLGITAKSLKVNQDLLLLQNGFRENQQPLEEMFVFNFQAKYFHLVKVDNNP